MLILHKFKEHSICSWNVNLRIVISNANLHNSQCILNTVRQHVTIQVIFSTKYNKKTFSLWKNAFYLKSEWFLKTTGDKRLHIFVSRPFPVVLTCSSCQKVSWQQNKQVLTFSLTYVHVFQQHTQSYLSEP